MAVEQTGDDRTAPNRPQCNGGRQVAILLEGEEWRRSRQGLRKLRLAVAGRRSRRSRSLVRQAPSRPRMGRRQGDEKRRKRMAPIESSLRPDPWSGGSSPLKNQGKTRILAEFPAGLACDRPSARYRRARSSPPGGHMAKQAKPFIVEIKPSRKVRPADRKTSIWGEVDLRTEPDMPLAAEPVEAPAALVQDDRS